MQSLDAQSRKMLNAYLLSIAKGNRESLKELYMCLKKPVYLFALSMVRQHETAEDMTQQTFLEVMKCAVNYRPNSNAKAWIFTIARNLCVDYLNKSKRETITDVEIMDSAYGASTSLTDNTVVYEALSKLSYIERQIVTLFIYSGFKQTEIAQILQLPYIKVRSMYGYAIRKLKEFYGDD
jgi:RNA polymerase sigma-70 factor (ECF subfamily)